MSQLTMFGAFNAPAPQPKPDLLPPAERARRLNSRDQVLAYLQLHGSATGEDLNRICFRYGARLQELRQAGYRITTEAVRGGLFRYRLEP